MVPVCPHVIMAGHTCQLGFVPKTHNVQQIHIQPIHLLQNFGDIVNVTRVTIGSKINVASVHAIQVQMIMVMAMFWVVHVGAIIPIHPIRIYQVRTNCIAVGVQEMHHTVQNLGNAYAMTNHTVYIFHGLIAVASGVVARFKTTMGMLQYQIRIQIKNNQNAPQGAF